MKIILLFALLALISCGKQGTSKIYSLKKEQVSKFVNEKSLPSDPNLTLDKSIINHEYPIQIALYQDGKFYYDLPNLGDGNGTWKQDGGKLILKAKRTLFDMYIEVHGSDVDGKNLSLQFSDRFGPTTLGTVNKNI